MTLTDTEWAFIAHCLGVASERFSENAKSLAELREHPRLVEQFVRQAGEATQLREKIQEHHGV